MEHALRFEYDVDGLSLQRNGSKIKNIDLQAYRNETTSKERKAKAAIKDVIE